MNDDFEPLPFETVLIPTPKPLSRSKSATTSIDEAQTPVEKIRVLNDALRIRGIGGRVMLTRSVSDFPPVKLARILDAVRSFSAFSADNDPHGEHDFAAMDVEGERVMFKIDYYDRTMQRHSPDAADPSVTKRVLTVMLADDY